MSTTYKVPVLVHAASTPSETPGSTNIHYIRINADGVVYGDAPDHLDHDLTLDDLGAADGDELSDYEPQAIIDAVTALIYEDTQASLELGPIEIVPDEK